MSSTKNFEVAGRVVPVEVVSGTRSRGLTLRADAVRGVVRVTHPARLRHGEVEAFVAAHRGWLAARIARWPVALPLVPGAMVPFDGGTLTLDWHPDWPRGVVRVGDRLRIGGAADAVPGRALRWLRATALAALTPATHSIASGIDRRVARVRVGDAAGRWGSCSTAGVIAYSWRLILAPPSVRHSVVAHEVAHLVHPNHGRDFWRLASALTGADLDASRAWLKANGPALHWVGRTG